MAIGQKPSGGLKLALKPSTGKPSPPRIKTGLKGAGTSEGKPTLKPKLAVKPAPKSKRKAKLAVKPVPKPKRKLTVKAVSDKASAPTAPQDRSGEATVVPAVDASLAGPVGSVGSGGDGAGGLQAQVVGDWSELDRSRTLHAYDVALSEEAELYVPGEGVPEGWSSNGDWDLTPDDDL